MSYRFKGSTRKERLPSNWSSLRSRVLRRDKYICVIKDCKDLATDVDHIVHGDNHSLDNLQSLCTYHHRLKTSQEGHKSRREKEDKMKKDFLRPKEIRFYE